MSKPLVSIIVPALNSATTIYRCLESIQRQTYQKIEIIVVDRGSADQTQAIAREFTSHVYTHGPERAAQVNFGAKKARGKYLYRVDSDFVLEREVVGQCVDACENKHLDGIAVHNTSAEGLGFWADVRKFERNTYRNDLLIVAVRFFTKRAWEEIGGFDETLYGPEDYDFHNRFVACGFQWGRIAAIERHLGEPQTLADIWKKHYYYGKQMVGYFQKHPAIALKQFSPIRRSYLLHLGDLLRNPLIFLGLIVMTIVKFTAGAVGFIQEGISAVWVKFFTKIRFWTGSFKEIALYVPNSGTILDLGCGYGIFSNYLASLSSKCTIVGIDMDESKIKYADKGFANTKFFVGDATKMRMKNLKAVLLLDVLHHLNSYGAQETLLKEVFKMISPGGKIIMSEVNSQPFWKLILARLTDLVLYPKDKVYYRYSKSMLALLGKLGKATIKTVTLANNPYPHILYIVTKK